MRPLTRVAATAPLAVLLALTACGAPRDEAEEATDATSESPAADACTPDTLETLSAGTLTIGTDSPAYEPWFVDDDPANGEGYESAVAYAIAEELGFDAEDVVWVRTSFDAAIAPGPKDFDFNLQQFTITPERAESIDFSSPYYAADQAVITIEGSAAADATSIADLQGLLIGAQTGTTSLAAVEQIIAPTAGAQVFNTNEDAKLALENGQVDAIVVDVPTAFYMTGVELDGGIIVGSLPEIEGAADEWGVVLTKGSPLTARVSAAVDALRESGKLDELIDAWLGADQGVPALD